MFLISSCSCLRPIHWSQVLSQEWRCSWSSADRLCSNYIWVINNFINFIFSCSSHSTFYCTSFFTFSSHFTFSCTSIVYIFFFAPLILHFPAPLFHVFLLLSFYIFQHLSFYIFQHFSFYIFQHLLFHIFLYLLFHISCSIPHFPAPLLPTYHMTGVSSVVGVGCGTTFHFLC